MTRDQESGVRSQESERQPLGLLLSDDLIFTSRITGTACDLGLQMKPARSMEVMKAQCSRQTPSCVVIDLANPGLIIGELTKWLKENCTPPPRIVAYGSHVDTETLRKARGAGRDPVLPRSKFVEELPAKLAEWIGR